MVGVIDLNAPNLSIRLSDDSARDQVTRLIRRICVLRERGDVAEANHLHATRLASAISEARAAPGGDAMNQTEIDRLFAAESARAAEAVIIADLLIQQLAERWPTSMGAAPRNAPAPESERPVNSSPPRSGPLEIADFLDAMLADDRAARRSVRT